MGMPALVEMPQASQAVAQFAASSTLVTTHEALEEGCNGQPRLPSMQAWAHQRHCGGTLPHLAALKPRLPCTCADQCSIFMADPRKIPNCLIFGTCVQIILVVVTCAGGPVQCGAGLWCCRWAGCHFRGCAAPMLPRGAPGRAAYRGCAWNACRCLQLSTAALHRSRCKQSGYTGRWHACLGDPGQPALTVPATQLSFEAAFRTQMKGNPHTRIAGLNPAGQSGREGIRRGAKGGNKASACA